MANKLNKRKKPSFTSTDNMFFNVTCASMKALFLYMYMDSKPDGWGFTIKSITSQQMEGEDAVSSGLKELEKVGLLSRKKLSTGEMEYILNDPTFLWQNGKTPNRENPKQASCAKTGKSQSGKIPVHSKESLLSNLNNKKLDKKDSENVGKTKAMAFVEFQELYPKAITASGMAYARSAFDEAVEKLGSCEAILENVKAYAEYVEATGKEIHYLPKAQNWLEGGAYATDWTAEAEKAGKKGQVSKETSSADDFANDPYFN